MNNIVDKLIQVRDEMIAEKGELQLLALALREGSPDRWDLIVAAPWVEPDKRETFEYVIGKLRARLTPSEFLRIARVAFPSPGTPWIEFTNALSVGPGILKIDTLDVGGVELKQVYVLASRSAQQPAPSP